MNVYFISGLGADEKMFKRIQLPKNFVMHQLPWIDPLQKESFQAYAKRLATGIQTQEPFILVGLSLGGMMSIEMNKFLRPVHTILISSATHKKDLPLWFTLAGHLGIYKIIPDYFYHHPNIFSEWLLGTKSKQDRQLLKEVMRDASTKFVKWAVPRILHWDNQFIPRRLSHLHGTSDIILPYHPSRRTVPVPGGTHFMVYNRAPDINQQLKIILDNTCS